MKKRLLAATILSTGLALGATGSLALAGGQASADTPIIIPLCSPGTPLPSGCINVLADVGPGTLVLGYGQNFLPIPPSVDVACHSDAAQSIVSTDIWLPLGFVAPTYIPLATVPEGGLC